MNKKLSEEKINNCPICGRRAHPLLSSGIHVEVPYFDNGKLIEKKHFHAGCIQSLETKLEEANRKLESLARMPYFKELQKLRGYATHTVNCEHKHLYCTCGLDKLLNQSKDE